MQSLHPRSLDVLGGRRSFGVGGRSGSLDRWPRRGRRRCTVLATVAVLSAVAAGCSGGSVAGDDSGLEPLVGAWRGVLLSGGGELPFRLRVDGEGSDPPAVVINGDVQQSFEVVTRQGAASYVLRFFGDGVGADSELVVKMSPDGGELHGYWRLRHVPVTEGSPHELVTQMPFSAARNDQRRFQRNDPALAIASPDGIAGLPDVGGDWRVRALGADVDLDAVWTLVQERERVEGEFGPGVEIPAAPANQRLEGIYRNGLLRLSLFDGYHAILLHARATAQGTLEGTLWRADREGAIWSGRRVEPAR